MDLDTQQMAAPAPDAAAFLKLLANQHWLRILCALTEQQLSVGELNKRVPLSPSALSQHLYLPASLSALFCEVD